MSKHSPTKWSCRKKNRHLLEVARALLFSSKVPNYLSGEAVLTVAYLIFKFQFILSKNVEFERKKNENHENDDSDEIIEMPQNDEPSFFFNGNDEPSKENSFKVGHKIWNGNVFVRKNHKESDESTSQHCQESESGNNQLPKKRKGKSIFVFESRILYPNIDNHVAVRKPIRSCSKHPISNFIPCSNLSSSFFAFTFKLSSLEIPKNIHDALEVPKWRGVVLEEMKVLEKNKTWSVMTLPDDKKTMGCKWVFTVKYNSYGSTERYKVCLVAKRFTQT
jgi:hypothetical protein